MAYGISVLTTEGMVSLTSIRSLRRVHFRACTGTSGSYTVTAAQATQSIALVEPEDGKAIPQVTLSGTTVSWKPQVNVGTTASSADFTIALLKMV